MATGFGMKATIAMISKKFSSVDDISTNKLTSWMEDHVKVSSTETQGRESSSNRKLVILDCRPEEEYNVSHLEQAIRVDYDKNAKEIVEQLPEHLQSDGGLINTDVVCYCSVGYRSSMVADKLQKYLKSPGGSQETKEDAPSVYNLEGSLFKWANEGRAMVDNNKAETKFAHPYNALFGKLLNSDLRKYAV